MRVLAWITDDQLYAHAGSDTLEKCSLQVEDIILQLKRGKIE
jgi:hypothetical protein